MKRMQWSRVPPDRSEFLNQKTEEECVLIAFGGNMRVWINPQTKVYYLESCCNGPSSWQEATL
jgi:hypothetical protein